MKLIASYSRNANRKIEATIHCNEKGDYPTDKIFWSLRVYSDSDMTVTTTGLHDHVSKFFPDPAKAQTWVDAQIIKIKEMVEDWRVNHLPETQYYEI